MLDGFRGPRARTNLVQEVQEYGDDTHIVGITKKEAAIRLELRGCWYRCYCCGSWRCASSYRTLSDIFFCPLGSYILPMRAIRPVSGVAKSTNSSFANNTRATIYWRSFCLQPQTELPHSPCTPTRQQRTVPRSRVFL